VSTYPNAGNTRSLTDLAERVALLGSAIILRGDLTSWVTRLGAASAAERADLVASLNPPLDDLVRIVGDFGSDLVLAEIGRAGVRLRRARCGS
jgi:hypothetical protein